MKRSTKQVFAWHLVGLCSVGGAVLVATGDVGLAMHIGSWLGALPAGILGVHYIYGGFPFTKPHPVED